MWLQTVNLLRESQNVQEIGFSAPKFEQRAVAGKRCNTSRAPPKKSVINWTWLRLSVSDWSKWFAISSPDVYAVPVTVLLVGLPYKNDKLRHLILLSRVTYWAPVQMVQHWYKPVQLYCLVINLPNSFLLYCKEKVVRPTKGRLKRQMMIAELLEFGKRHKERER